MVSKCALCEKEVPEDNFCHGCKEFVCDGCSGGFNAPMGGHDLMDHEEALDDEDDEDGED